ncbi:TetR/AcrR family transcriptional regulator [Streptacidiphilus carbonis]|jgi:AcrR family transcriptional regulator|uniref:TetR/AcrR family transcriptional regulator n=1 Tax=Streptacidiphilus carbonis TaxID=105422 RepID=UPI0005A70C87|nr:TetR/AcrR family transcriptional regulator [Streptacidiphilus carbonis]
MATSARERLLNAATELFYEEGVHTVGIDRVIERAGVAKATLYNTFGSKDALIRAYLADRHESRRSRITAKVEQQTDPRLRLLAVFDALGDSIAAPNYRGCAFVNASAEASRDSSIQQVSTEYRGWVRGLFADLARAAGAADAELLARRLMLLYDGASIAARMDGDPDAAGLARSTAADLLDAATAPTGAATGAATAKRV